MAFGQVQGSAWGGGPPLPQRLTHLKEAEQQGQSTVVGKFPYMSRMVHLPWVSVGLPTPTLGPAGAPRVSPW